MIKINRITELVSKVKILLGADELELKRASVDAIRPRTVKGCQREIKDMARKGRISILSFDKLN